MIYRIYTLTCPIDNSVKYIGVTKSSFKARLCSHMCDYYTNDKKVEWIKLLRAKGLKPIIEEVDKIIVRTKKERIYKLERYWIAQFKCWGFTLYNINTQTKLD